MMNQPDFIKLPDPPEPMDPHKLGVLLIYILLVVCGAVMAWTIYSGQRL